MALIDLHGKKFGRYTVVGRGPNRKDRAMWDCVCECGTRRLVYSDNLRCGNSYSCGCYGKEVATKHGGQVGGKFSREYSSWVAAKHRCVGKNHHSYMNYGGRGITMCERWQKSFAAFRDDMGQCPPGFELDRIDPNGNYEPANCRWADETTQCRNRRNVPFFEMGGERMTLADWSEKLNIKRTLLYSRVLTPQHKRHMTLSEAVADIRRKYGASIPGSELNNKYSHRKNVGSVNREIDLQGSATVDGGNDKRAGL